MFVLLWVFGREVEPVEAALTVLLAIEKLTQVEVAVGVNLDALAVFLVISEVAFVKASLFGDGNTLALSVLADDLPKIDLPVAFDEFEVLAVE
jgi:hypothetical protein